MLAYIELVLYFNRYLRSKTKKARTWLKDVLAKINKVMMLKILLPNLT